jgi:hypothetical protein
MVGEDGNFSPHGPAAKLEVTGYHRAFLIGVDASHINDLDSKRDNDHTGLSRMQELSAIMDILRANEAEPQAPQNMRLFIPYRRQMKTSLTQRQRCGPRKWPRRSDGQL